MLNKFVRNSRNLFIVGALLAIVAFGLAFTVLSKAQQAPQSLAAAPAAPLPSPPVLIASAELPAYSQVADPKLAAKLFTAMPYDLYIKTKGAPPVDYVKGMAGLQGLLTPTGGGPRHLAFALTSGSPLLASELLTSTVAGMVDYSTMLNKDEVAEAVAVPATGAGNGNIQPSDHVDLIASYKVSVSETPPGLPGIDLTSRVRKNVQQPYGTWQSQTVIENARVLAVAATGTGYTVAVTHQDAVVLNWVKNTGGSIDLVVRSVSDIDNKTQGAKTFTTQPVLPGYMTNNMRYNNNFKQS